MRVLIAVSASLCTALSVCPDQASAQPAPLEQMEVAVNIDSGFIINTTAVRGNAFGTIVRVPDATWIRLIFDEATLGEAPASGRDDGPRPLDQDAGGGGDAGKRGAPFG